MMSDQELKKMIQKEKERGATTTPASPFIDDFDGYKDYNKRLNVFRKIFAILLKSEYRYQNKKSLWWGRLSSITPIFNILRTSS